VLYHDDLVNTTDSQVYTYDNLNRLTGFTQGTINSTLNSITGSPAGPGQYTNTTTNPDGTRLVDTFSDGLLSQEQHLGTDGTTVLSSVSYVYDPFRRLNTSTDSTGITTYGYFQDGTQSNVKLPGHATAQTVTALNLSTDDPVKQIRSDSNTVTTPETSQGQTAGQSGAGVLAAAYAYDPYTGGLNGFNINALYNSTDPSTADNTTWSFDQRTGLPVTDALNGYQYATSRRLQARSGAAGGFGPSYNNAGEVTANGSDWQSTGIDELSRLTGTIDGADGKTSATAVSYTPLGQLNQTTFGSAGGTIVGYDYFPTTGYGATGSPQALQLLTLTPPDEQAPVTTGYAYDPIGKRLQTITVNGVNITYAYQPDSDQVQSITAGSVQTTFTPDSADGARIGEINVQNTADQSTLFDDTITAYNAQDQRTSETVSRMGFGGQGLITKTMGYTYDPAQADALTSVPKNGVTTAGYSYDAMGNRIGGPLGYYRDAMVDAALNSGNSYNTDVQFDDRERESDDTAFTYAYDDQNRVQSATPDSPATGSLQAKFGYDSQNRLLWEDVNSFNASTGTWSLSYSRHFVWDGWNMLATLDQNNTLLQSYTYGPTGLVAITSYPADPANPSPENGATTYLVIKDASGNVSELVNTATGSPDATYRYDAYGVPLLANGPAAGISPFRFAGGYRDPVTGLSYFQNRWYSPSQGRFMTQDPSGVNGGLNFYEYANNDPINFSDPSGTSAIYSYDKYVTTDRNFNRIVKYVVNAQEFSVSSAGVGAPGFTSWGPKVPVGTYEHTLYLTAADRATESQFDQLVELSVNSLRDNADSAQRVALMEGGLGLIPGFSATDHATQGKWSGWDTLDVGLTVALPGLTRFAPGIAGLVRGAGRASAEAEIAARALAPVEFGAADVTAANSASEVVTAAGSFEPRIAESVSAPRTALIDPQLDTNLLIRLSQGDPAVVAYAQANRAAGLSYNLSSRFEFLTGGTRADLQMLEQQYGIGLIRQVPLPELQNTAARLRAAFTDGRILGYWDSQVAASAYLRGERLATGDLQFFKRAADLRLSVEFVGSGNAAAKASAYVANPVIVP
jgi:RHS repeat-associated protein